MFEKAKRTDFKTKEELLARDVIDYLLKKEMMDDTFIYVGGKRYGTYDGEKGYHYGTSSWDDMYVEENKDPSRYCQYAGNIMSISSEGFLYDCLNYGFEFGSHVEDELDDIFKKHGCYFEMCTSWFLTAVKL